MQTQTINLTINGVEVDAEVRFHYEPASMPPFGCHPDSMFESIPEQFDLQALLIDGEFCNVLLDYLEDEIVRQLRLLRG